MIIAVIRKGDKTIIRSDEVVPLTRLEVQLVRDFSHLIPHNVEITLYDFIVRILNNYKGKRTYHLLREVITSYDMKLSDFNHIRKEKK